MMHQYSSVKLIQIQCSAGNQPEAGARGRISDKTIACSIRRRMRTTVILRGLRNSCEGDSGCLGGLDSAALLIGKEVLLLIDHDWIFHRSLDSVPKNDSCLKSSFGR